MRIGAHVSVAKGLSEALDYAESVGCECIQLFAKSPRRWNGPPIDHEMGRRFDLERRSRRAGPLFTHTAYLINLTTTDEALLERSVDALADELLRAAALGADAVVTHVGNDPGCDAVAAARRGAHAVNSAYDRAGPDARLMRLLLENTAGAGSAFGGSMAELSSLIELTGRSSESLGLCIDTCHAFAYGYALDDPRGWTSLVDEIEGLIGLERLGLVHANDCMFERGSKRDRHAWIGDGSIGQAGFAAMLCEPRTAHVSAITEMPGEVPQKDAQNIARLVSLRDEC